MLLTVGLPVWALSQPVITARNMSLGGGGVAYLTGVDANFLNPANLMIRDRTTTIHITAGSGGFFFDPVLSTPDLSEQVKNFYDVYSIYEPGEQLFTGDQADDLLDLNYDENELVSEHQNRFDLILGGIQWQREDKTFSLVARSRMATRTEIGRGWYDTEFVNLGEKTVRDFTLVQQTNVIHEISFGYAKNLELISGLIPKLNNIYLGVAPKILLGGSFMDFQTSAQVMQNESLSVPQLVRSAEIHASGDYSRLITQYQAGSTPAAAISDQISPTYFKEADNFGVGFDFGITYVLYLGSDVTINEAGEEIKPLNKSIRIGLSVTDLGFQRISEDPLLITKNSDTTAVSSPLPAASSKFIGAPGQIIDFLDNADPLLNSLNEFDERNTDSFNALLPTSFNGGLMFEINRLKVMGDFTLGLNDTAFNTTRFTGHIGLEVRPLPQVPIRAGTRFAKGYPTFLGLGFGIEQTHWDFIFSTQISMRSNSVSSELVGTSFGGIRLHF